ncbi:MAG TPA: adenylate/guanylate cyclase domain-containing protein [Actinomycetales bacterium]|nr:adenylate/guanylate cyclase domain-containing protein [Actinomycetales bacterium]
MPDGPPNGGPPGDDAVPLSFPSTDEEHLLGGRRTLHRRDVSRAAGVSLLSARKFWRALGFPIVDDDEAAFTDADVAALHSVVALVRDGLLDERTALGMTRAVGRSLDRLATWQVQLLAEHVAEIDLTDPEHPPDAATPDERAAQQTSELFAQIVDRLEPLVIYAWRRQAASALARIVADSAPEALAEDDSDPAAPVTVRAVGFADLVSFTRLVRRLTERELATMVQHFEALASDVVTAHGGRVVKTVGDEVLFVCSPGATAAAIALAIPGALAEDDLLPPVRVGMATGPVVGRLGDVFGTTVNRASRLTALARPGTVLVDVATVHSLAGVTGIEVRQLRGRSLRGIGHVVPWLLRSAVDGTSQYGAGRDDAERG